MVRLVIATEIFEEMGDAGQPLYATALQVQILALAACW